MHGQSVHLHQQQHDFGLSEATWQALYSAIPEPVFVCQPNNSGQADAILFLNDAARELLSSTRLDSEATVARSAADDAPQRVADVMIDAAGRVPDLCDGQEVRAYVLLSGNRRHPAVACCRRVTIEDTDLLVVTARSGSSETPVSDRKLHSDDLLADEQYKQLLEIFQVPVTVLDEACRIVLMNAAGAANLQTTPQKVEGKSFGDILPEFAELTQQRVTATLECGEQLTFEDPVELHDGERWFRTVMQPMKGPDGRRLIWSVSYEFTEERGTQRELIETNERIRSLAANIPGAIFQLIRTSNGMLKFPYLSDAVSRVLGPAAEAAREDPRIISDIIHPEDREGFRSSIRTSVRTRSDWKWEGRFLDGDEVRWMQAASCFRRTQEGEARWDGVIMDVTNWHRLDESLQSQEQQFQMLVEACQDGIVVHDGKTFLFANSAAAEMFRAESPEHLIGLSLTDVIGENARAAIQERINRVLNHESVPYAEVTLQRLDGTTLIVEGSGKSVVYRGRSCAQVVMRDVTERNAWARTIRQSEEKFRALFDQAPIGIAMIDSAGCARMSNTALQAFFGYSEDLLRRVPVNDLLVRDHKNPLPLNWQDLLARFPDGQATEQQFYRSDGSQVWGNLTVTALPAGDFASPASLLMLQDVSDRKQAEERTRHLQKMEAIGHLTGGVAHDFNNLLAVISGNLELLGSELTDPSHLELTSNASTAADRGARLTRQLLAFGRRAPLRPEIVDINAVITEWQHLLHRTIPASIRIDCSLHHAPIRADVDEAELENALLNLALNAKDAMPDGGSLTIGTRLIPQKALPATGDLQPCDHISIQFTDTGFGMDSSVKNRAFDPFFTTKDAGAGSGLGLSMVYGFMKQSGGHVTIRSSLNLGTTVELLLPCAKDPTESEASGTTRVSAIPGSETGEIILVVEDDASVRDVILRQLNMLGYRTVAANCGADAMEIIQSDRHLDGLLTDIVMPGELQGPQLVTEARQARPGIGAVLMSGYTNEMPRLSADEATGRLAKPFSIHDLASALRQALQRRV